MPPVRGEVGSKFLDILEVIDAIRTKVRAKAREALAEDPDCLPGWAIQKTCNRELIDNPEAIVAALQEVFPEVPREEILSVFRTSFAALGRLLIKFLPDANKAAVTSKLNVALNAVTRIGGPITRLIRTKPARTPLSQRNWTPPE
jgi:hypothetical protein